MVLIGSIIAVVALVLFVLASRQDRDPADDGGDTVEQLLAGGRKVQAIKRYRELHGGSLTAAVDAVEKLQKKVGGKP